MSVYFGSAVFFMIIYLSIRYFLENIYQEKEYMKKTFKDRCFIMSCWTANIHHIIVAVYAFYNLTNPMCEKYDGFFTWFKDEKCLVTMDKRHVYVSLITGGYLVSDGIVQFGFAKSFDALGI